MAEEIPGEARQWAMACHLIALVGLIGNVVGFGLGPLIIWLLKKDDHPFIDEQGKEALNFQITMFIALAISFLLAMVFIFIGIVLLIIVGLFMTIFPIIAAIKVTDSMHYRYPFSMRFIK